MQKFLLSHPQAALVMIQEIGRRLRQTNKLVSQRLTRNINVEMDEKMTVGQRVADKVAAFGGSWTFIFIFVGFLLVWMIVNSILIGKLSSGQQFDAYPYILLNLMLSMTAALQAPIIMMSQNRASEKDRLAAENDFRVNLKSELMLEEMTRRMERLQNDQVQELLLLTRALHLAVPGPGPQRRTTARALARLDPARRMMYDSALTTNSITNNAYKRQHQQRYFCEQNQTQYAGAARPAAATLQRRTGGARRRRTAQRADGSGARRHARARARNGGRT